VGRLRYILAHGVKENLVERVLDWPGVHAARAILEDKLLKGYWFDRTQEYAARNHGEEYGRLTYATEEMFFLSCLPCWEHLSSEQYRERVAAIIEEIEIEARLARLERGIPVLGPVERSSGRIPHPTQQDEEVASPALPRREQGDPGWPAGDLWPLPPVGVEPARPPPLPCCGKPALAREARPRRMWCLRVPSKSQVVSSLPAGLVARGLLTPPPRMRAPEAPRHLPDPWLSRLLAFGRGPIRARRAHEAAIPVRRHRPNQRP
jgi:hypothetical protein